MSTSRPVREFSGPGLRVRSLSARQTLILEDPCLVWLVRYGVAEVFSSRVEDGLPVGRRRFLFRARARDALFAIAERGNRSASRLMLMAGDAVTLLEAPLDRLAEACAYERTS